MKVIAALPAFNEASYVGSVVLLARKYVDEVLVFDDGSQDATVEVARLASATVIINDKNIGYGANIQNIIREGKQRNVDVLVLLDADSQHDPKDIPNMIKPVMEGYDLVIGSRNTKQIPFYRRIGQKTLSAFTNRINKSNVKDTQSGFRAFSRKALTLLSLKENGMAVSSEMCSEAVRLGLNIIEVPISVKYTKDGSTLNPIYQGSNSLARVIVMISKRRPLMFFGGGGFIVLIIGLLVGLQGYQMFLANKLLPIGTVLASVMLVIIGILSVFTGIILNAMVKD